MAARLILQIILIALCAFFSCAESAVIAISDPQLEKLAASGDKRAVRLKKLTGKPARFLAAVQAAVLLAGFLGAALAADSFAGPLAELIEKADTGLPSGVIKAAAIAAVTLVLTFVTLVLGILVPKRAAAFDACN